jgi:hypothetical protein
LRGSSSHVKEGKIDLWRSIEKMGEVYAREISRPEEKFFWDLTLKRGYIMAEASIRWAAECLKELADLEKPPEGFNREVKSLTGGLRKNRDVRCGLK